jgi:O-antigen/teichoic acid export membrane protein
VAESIRAVCSPSVIRGPSRHGRTVRSLLPRLSVLARRPAPEGEQRNPLPEGTLAVGAGLLVSGFSAYAFLKIARDALGGTDSNASLSLTLLWFLTFILAPGFFLPLEQEVGRALAHRRALGQGSLPVVAKASALGAVLALVLVVATGATSPLTSEHLFHGSAALSGCLALAIVGYGTTHFTRGVLSGSDEFGRYGFLLGADGALRVAGCVVLAVAGVEVVGWYGLLVGLPPLIAAALAVRGRRDLLTPGPPAAWSELTPNLGWLLAGSFLAASLVNAGPLAAKLLADDSQDELVNHFSAGVLISRIPLFLFQAVQAALLPKLAKLAATGEFGAFREGFRRLLIVVGGVGVIGTLGAAAIGPIAIKVFNAELSRRDLTLLALGSAIYMLAVALAQALIALHHHAKVAAGWLAAMTVFIAVTAVAGDDLLLRVEIALAAAPVAALVMFTFALRTALAAGEGPDADSLHLALHEIPYEP